VYDALFAREKLGSTGLGQGIAIPHGRIKGLKAPVGAFVRLVNGVQFDAPDGKPVGLIFVLLVPEAANEHHLQLLSELAQMFSDREFREQLAAVQRTPPRCTACSPIGTPADRFRAVRAQPGAPAAHVGQRRR
jgi:mannitol/fructose-specific phosphotransferase system IIA component (Ntr-type)